jgi:hypothetical protein
MDDFALMMHRATEPPPADLETRIMERLERELTTGMVSSDGLRAFDQREPFGEAPSSSSVRFRRRAWVAAAMVAVIATVAAAIASTALRDDHDVGGSPAPDVVAPGAGRLPARVALGASPFTLTWLPPDYRAVSSTESTLSITAPEAVNAPSMTVSAKPGTVAIEAPLLALGPLADAHHDEAAGVLRWNRAGWNFEIDADAVVAPAVLLRLAVGTVPTGDLDVAVADPTIPVVVPDIVGLDYRDATAQLAAAGLSVRWAISSTAITGVGVVERSEPAAGAASHRGAVVVLGVVGTLSDTPLVGFAGTSGDLPDAVGYFPPWTIGALSLDPLVVEQSQPIVFLHGELVGYGVGPSFETLARAAAATTPAPPDDAGTEASPTTAETAPEITSRSTRASDEAGSPPWTPGQARLTRALDGSSSVVEVPTSRDR